MEPNAGYDEDKVTTGSRQEAVRAREREREGETGSGRGRKRSRMRHVSTWLLANGITQGVATYYQKLKVMYYKRDLKPSC